MDISRLYENVLEQNFCFNFTLVEQTNVCVKQNARK